MGKAPVEVRALLGPPKRENESPTEVSWDYEDRTTAPATSKLDRQVTVVFEGGWVVRADY